MNENDDIKNIVCICKNQYAEAKIAYETLTIYWRLVSSGIDGQTIAHLVCNDEEKKIKNKEKIRLYLLQQLMIKEHHE